MKSKEKHHKHPPLKRPQNGGYHKLEWAIYGTTCGEIESFFYAISEQFFSKYRLSYIDADHSEDQKETMLQVGKKQYTQRHIFPPNSFDDKFNTTLSQAVFINGNHYPGQRQIVIINPSKKDSLYRRVAQLDRIEMVLVPDDTTEIYDFVKDKMSEETVVYRLDQKEEIYTFIEDKINQSIPAVKALVLAGGKSTRMQEDKSQLKYHNGVTQEVHLAQMCQKLGLDTFISKSASSTDSEIGDFKVIKDRFIDMGPFGAILSAFIEDPGAAWLVLACDLPYMTHDFISQLIDERSIQHYATAYKVMDNPFPEPLMAIYEPSIYKRMLEFLSLGYACPRKVLINSEVLHIPLADRHIAFNANTPNEKETVMDALNKKA